MKVEKFNEFRVPFFGKPTNWTMFTDEGNKAVDKAVKQFVRKLPRTPINKLEQKIANVFQTVLDQGHKEVLDTAVRKAVLSRIDAEVRRFGFTFTD